MLFQSGTVQRISGNQLDVASGRLTNGMQVITDALAASCPEDSISLATTVTSIDTVIESTAANPARGDRLIVRTDSASIEATHVVLAVPPALALATIDFGDDARESLGDHVAAVAATTPVWMGSTVKIVAVYERAFWRDAGLAGAVFSHDGPMREIHDMSGPNATPAALFGFCSIPPGEPAPTEQQARDQLEALFGADGAAATEIHIQDWRSEVHTSHRATLELRNYETYGHRIFQAPAMQGRLHWASTETSPIAPGHVEGALVAGTRAADAILANLRSG